MVNAFFLAGLNEVHYSVMNKVIAAGKKAGILSESITLEAQNDTLYVYAHEVLFPCGLYCNTDSVYTLTVSDYGLIRSTSKSAWTIIWEVDSNLVSAPALRLIQGFVQQSSLTKFQVAIGWIAYAGANSDVDSAILVPNVKSSKVLFKTGRPSIDLVRKSLPNGVSAEEVVGDYQSTLRLINSGASSVVAELGIYGMAEDQIPGELVLNTTASDVGFSISAEISTAAGSGVSAGNTAALAAGTGSIRFPLSYQREYFSNWSPFAINLYVRIPALGSVSVNHVIVTSSPRLSVG